MTLCAIGSKKKKKRKLLPALKGLTAPSYDQVPNPLCSTSVHLFMNLSLALFLTGRTRTVFFSSVSEKKKKKESSDSLPIAEEKPFVLMEQGV